MGIEEIIGSKREEILRLAEEHGAENVRVFGDIARGEGAMDSDVHLLIDMGEHTTPWFPGGFVADLEDLLGRHVHISFADSVPPYAKRILEEAVPL